MAFLCTSAKSGIKELNSRIYSREAHIFLLEIVDTILFLVFVFIEQNKQTKTLILLNCQSQIYGISWFVRYISIEASESILWKIFYAAYLPTFSAEALFPEGHFHLDNLPIELSNFQRKNLQIIGSRFG